MAKFNRSVTMDSNPEGVNQYTGGSSAAKAEKLSAAKAKMGGGRQKENHEMTKAASAATKAAGKAGTYQAHMAASKAHEQAANYHHATGANSVAAHHESAKAAHQQAAKSALSR